MLHRTSIADIRMMEASARVDGTGVLPGAYCGVSAQLGRSDEHRRWRDFGGRQGIRTPGLLVANEALSHLS